MPSRRNPFDSFTLAMSALVAVAIAVFIIVLSRMIAGGTQGEFVKEDPLARSQLEERIAPIGRVAIAGQDNSSAAPAPRERPVPQATASVPTATLSGEQVYQSACVACHAAGVGGAPKLGDPAGWSARIARGTDTLYTHALQGYQGEAGYMPPKGGRIDLSDAQVRAAVDYMVNQAK